MAVTIDRQYMQALSDEAYAIDEQLNSAGTPAAGKRAIVNRLVKENTADISGILSYFESLPNVEARLATFEKIKDAVEAANKTDFALYLDAAVAASPKVEIDDSQINVLRERRKQIKLRWDAAANMLPFMFEPGDPEGDISAIPVPQKLTQVRALRGPSPLAEFQFSINGKDLSKADNKQKFVASRFTKPDKDGTLVKWTPRDFRDYGVSACKAEGVELDWKNPPASFSFTLPDGTIFKAVKIDAPDDDDDDDGSDD